MITVISDNKEIPVNMVEFSDGALTFKMVVDPDSKYTSVTVCPSTPVYRVFEELRLFFECLHKVSNEEKDMPYCGKIIINLPYLPYARCDRIFEKGNPNGLERFMLDLEEMGYWDEMFICDIHNKNAVDTILKNHLLTWNINEKSQLQCFKESLSYDVEKDWDLVIAPDKGAVEKAKTISEDLKIPCVFANKKRDLSTGKLTEMLLPDYDFTGKKVLIPDDIGDGLGTHVWLGELLKKAGAKQVDLYVTHLIAPKGLKHLTGIIDNVYCHHTVAGYLNKQDVTDFNSNK